MDFCNSSSKIACEKIITTQICTPKELNSSSASFCRIQKEGTAWQGKKSLQGHDEEEALPEISLGPVQFLDWEDRIFWGDQAAATLRSACEEDDCSIGERSKHCQTFKGSNDRHV